MAGADLANFAKLRRKRFLSVGGRLLCAKAHFATLRSELKGGLFFSRNFANFAKLRQQRKTSIDAALPHSKDDFATLREEHMGV